MTEKEAKNILSKYNRRLKQFGENLGTGSAQYQNLLRMGEMIGLEFATYANSDVQSAFGGKEAYTKINEDFERAVNSVPTWEKTKEWYINRLDIKGLSREEQKQAIKEEAEFIANIRDTIKTLFTEVYDWEKAHNFEYIIPTFHEGKDDAWHYTKEQFKAWADKIHEEMASGGTKKQEEYEQMSGDIAKDLYELM